MSKQKKMNNLKPFFSVIIFIAALFCIVFCKMELRRMGYTVWKLSREEVVTRDVERLRSLEYAKLVRPERIEKYAKTFWALNRPEKSQIIPMGEKQIALRQ
jgi:hypothetical protein